MSGISWKARWRGLVLRLLSMMLVGSLAIFAERAGAEEYPNRPIRLIHGFSAGGAADTLSRILANGLSKRLGQQVVVETKPGAGGNLGATAIAKAEPDGYTIGLVTGAHAISGALYKSLQYISVDSFAMISTVVYYALVIAVRSDFRGEVPEGADRARQGKAGVSVSVRVGFGSTHHLAGELLDPRPASRWFMFPTAAMLKRLVRCSAARFR